MRSIEKFMISGTRSAGTPAKERRPRTGFLVLMVIALTAFMIWSELLLFSIPGALDAAVSVFR